MVDQLIIEDDRHSLFLVPTTSHDDWINFRVRTFSKSGKRVLRTRLAYSRHQQRLSEGKAARSFREKNPEALGEVVELIERAIREGLI